ncbi:adhesion G protein-coupled receptor E2 [Myripristis murdjan]|uniref:adhesion G protein-coupled receptor E2 n=1 Tax=Myripristis murdjan TaxID=586833 RepID=UPI001175EE78|nr:adhesion G protein-coupled receptor E2-like [Myripristis murdjan]
MASRGKLLIVVLHLSVMTVLSHTTCPKGFHLQKQQCVDYDECEFDEDYEANPCGENAECINTEGSFYCHCADGAVLSAGTCKDVNECVENGDICGPNAKCYNTIPYYSCICDDGFITNTGAETFRQGDNVTCRDIDECQTSNLCGQNAACVNTLGSFYCACNPGFRLRSGNTNFSENGEQCEDICIIDMTICGNGTCHHEASGHYCACHAGFTNYGNKEARCTELSCNAFKNDKSPDEKLPGTEDVMRLMESRCLELTESESPAELDGEALLERLLSMIDELLSSGALTDNRKVSTFLDLVETAMRMIGPLIKLPKIKKSSVHSELELQIRRGAVLPKGPVTLASRHAQLNISLETAAGEASFYPGFATVSLLSYKNLEGSTDGFFSGMEKNKSFEINSKVVTAVVSNRDTSHLNEPVILTLYHLKQSNEHNHTCVYWDSTEGGGTWSARGCSVMESNADYTVCSCNHLSSFAVLMALHEIEDRFDLQLITWVGLSLSLLCLFICILTFSLVRSIQSPRTTIHLHLCISLFIANLVFLAGISRTENRLGCAVVAGLLHYFYLAAFCWMCLEGVQLFRMVVLVFNTNFKTIPMLAVGYGVPAVIVAVSAIVNAKGYGTKRHCWLNLEDAFIWSFFGPVCVIIIINIFFFLITVWKLAQKFSSLNPDLTNLRKIKAFTITAVAQLCVLGTMWIFGCFQFDEGTSAMTYLFTLLNSLQGVLLFIMHCLLSKQVREEYGSFLSSFCAPQKKKYSEFTSSQASKAQTSKSTQNTGESHI